jgi:hypothetical protein
MTETPLGKDELQQRLGHSTFIDFLNLKVLSADPEKQEITMRAAMRPEFERGRGTGNGMADQSPRSSTRSEITRWSCCSAGRCRR